MEKTRHLMCCHDGCTIGIYGYIVITIRVMFDVAAYFSDKEYFLKYGENVCVQLVVGKPSLYITGMCSSSDQQFLYSDIRLEDISLLTENLKTSDGIPIKDKMRICKGFTCMPIWGWLTKRRGFFCSSYSIQGNFSANLWYTLQSKSLSLQERINKVTETESTLQRIRRGDVKLFHKLKNYEIIDELHQRKVKFSSKLNGENLLIMLEHETDGIQMDGCTFVQIFWTIRYTKS